ncbi:Alpha/Beta hydrolase protein [Dipodascopsis uninucleata]
MKIMQLFNRLKAVALLLVFTSSALAKPRPVVMWHGLGDEYNSDGMMRMASLIEDLYPDIFIHSVYLDEDPKKDSQASFFGNLNEQIETVCEQLASIPELEDGFDALGFSQGGLFMRGYVERCNSPKVHNLLTFGSPQNGVADFPPCKARDFLCRQRNAALKSQVWRPYAQNGVTVAQYYRNPDEYEQYLEYSGYLADINNERIEKNMTYAENLKSLEKLILYLFTEDETVVPKESAWLADFDKSTGEVTLLQDRKMYTENWLGFKELDKDGKLEFYMIEGRHMRITNDTMIEIAKTYLGTDASESHVASVEAVNEDPLAVEHIKSKLAIQQVLAPYMTMLYF